MNKLGLTMVILMLFRAALCAQETTMTAASPDVAVPYRDENDTAGASEIIFSNLTPSSGDLYNGDPDEALTIAGKSASGQTEEWFAVQFTPKVDARAKVLLAAVGYSYGSKRIKLGIYTNDRVTQSVGRLVQGGEGSTSQIPPLGSCCQLARVILPGEGAMLKGKNRYWLVASSDDVNAPTFTGGWHLSNVAQTAYSLAGAPWAVNPGAWPAAQIRGTRMQASRAAEHGNNNTNCRNTIGTANDAIIFTNLGPTPTNLYNSYAGGFYVAGNNAADVSELWEALPFTVKTTCHAKTLAAAIGYLSGTKRVNLGIYSDSGGNVGTLLPGGQASTTEMPDFEECCGLAQVTLPGAGVALSPGKYWLVASPDNVNAADFEGLWQGSNLAFTAFRYPEDFGNWITASGLWLAAEISGTTP